MVSAVVQPQPQPRPSPVAPDSVRQMAAAGYFRAIALWLNEPLAPQGIFVQVQTDRPGGLKLLVEFEHPPIKERLLRFLCHRIWLLNSELIEGIYVVARPLERRQILWQQRVKIVTPALKKRKIAVRVVHPNQPNSSLPPQIHPPRPRWGPRSTQRIKALRAFVLTGSAVAAFIFGCLLEVITNGATPTPLSSTAQSTSVPLTDSSLVTDPSQEADYPMARGAAASGGRDGRAVAARTATPRSNIVDTVLEPVGVTPHQKPTLVPADDVTLLFGGDISLDAINSDQLEAEGGFFAEVEDYALADVSMVNLATPLATAATNLQEEFRQRTRTEAVKTMVDSGVDIVNLTHSGLMQYGAEGLTETLNTLDSKGLYRIGAGRSAVEARRPEILDVKGKRIAYLSYAMGGKDAAQDDDKLKARAGIGDPAVTKEVLNFKTAAAFKDRAGFNAQDMPAIVADIQALRNEVDWIVVNFRWVDNITAQPNFMQTNLARLAIDQGADVVVGYHPTVIQGGEVYKGRPIAYSLGDFVFKADQPIADQDSAILKVALQDDQMRVEFVPVRVRDSRPKTLANAEGEAVLDRIEQASAQFDQPLNSPLVLDLKPAAAPAQTVDPDSPFVSPDAPETLPVLPEEKAAPAESAPEPALTDAASPTDDLESLPELHIEQELNDALPEWGPKPSTQRQQPFKPIPQDRSGASMGRTESRILPQIQTPAQNTRPAATAPVAETPSGERSAATWADSLPPEPGATVDRPPTTPTTAQSLPTSTETGEEAGEEAQVDLAQPTPRAQRVRVRDR